VDLTDAVTDADHRIGPTDARVVVVEYGDFECPNCKQAVAAVEMLLDRFEGNLQFVYRHYPLEQVHPHAIAAAEAAEAAGAQGRFWEMHAQLFEHQRALERTHLDEYARQLGLDMRRFADEMDRRVHLPLVRAHLDSGKRSGVRGTPGFFVNGRRQDVSFGLHLLSDAAAAALDRT
jgi:protein-disulfide isomerase